MKTLENALQRNDFKARRPGAPVTKPKPSDGPKSKGNSGVQGDVAQCLLCMYEVLGSIPSISKLYGQEAPQLPCVHCVYGRSFMKT